jgi:integrase
MLKPKKIILKDNSVVWEVSGRNNGRGSRQIKRRFPSQKLAQEFLGSFKIEKKKLRHGIVEVGSFHETTFADEAQNWLEELEFRVSPGHFKRAKAIIEEFNNSFGRLEPNIVTHEFLSRFQKILKKRSGRKRDSIISNTTINRHTEIICAVLNYSAQKRRIPFSPVSGFKKLPKTHNEMSFWSEEEAASFLAWANKKYCDLSNLKKFSARKHYVAYLLALNTGMRAGEIWGLKPMDFCFVDGDVGDTLFIRRQLNFVTKQLAPLKGELNSKKDKSRHVPCHKELRKELETLIRFNNTHHDMAVFQSINGKFVCHDSFVDRFNRDLKSWKGRKLRFHDLRHTAATLMLSKGIDVKTVSEILGHEDITTTMNYVHLLGHKIKNVAKHFSVMPEKPTLRLVSNSIS